MLRASCLDVCLLFLLIVHFLAVSVHAEDGELADRRGMLLTEVGLLRQVIFEYVSSTDPSLHLVLQDVADGKTWSAIHQLGSKLEPSYKIHQQMMSEPIGIRELGILRALADIGIFEIVASLEATGLRTVNRTIQTIHTIHPHQSRSHWLMSLAKDLQWLTQVLPRGDRTLVAIAHAVASHVMFASLGADSDGYVRIESMSSITQAWWLAEQAASAKVRSMCEVGFNGGHSALAMLLSAAIDASMISFDLMSKSYTPACHRLVRLAFPHRHILVEGPSNLSIRNFVLSNLQSKCDLIFIDGGHAEKEALSDLLHMSMLATEGALLVMDDVGCQSNFCEGPTKAWKSFTLSGRVLELGCQEEAERRWCWGTYNR